MSWKRHHTLVRKTSRHRPGPVEQDPSLGSSNNYSSVLPEVYAGHPERINRYSQYDQMDDDSEVASALDTIADFSTQSDPSSSALFQIKFHDDPSDTQVNILNTMLHQWCKVNLFKKKLWRMFRNVIKYGDEILLRDPETLELYRVDPRKVEAVLVSSESGKKESIYLIKDLDINTETLMATVSNQYGANTTNGGTTSLQNPLTPGNYVSAGRAGSYPDGNTNVTPIDGSHIVHLSITEDLDSNWPFGTSVLESVFKTFKQKEMLEDAMLIYRIQRAPERRVFYVDVGNMPPHKAHTYVERLKNEIHQRRLPSRTGGGCFDMSTRVPLLDGRTLSISELADEYNSGKENWIYSCDPVTGKIVPGNITWAGVTRKQAQVMKITLDNGQEITCTLDHKFPVWGKGFVEAKDITFDDSLISFETKNTLVSKGSNEYQQVFDHESKTWIFTHRVVANFMKDKNRHNEMTYLDEYSNSRKGTIHHKNFKDENNVFNHRIVKVEYIETPMDVGTITVDGDELYHDYHTFALEVGVFTKNSSVTDAAYNPMSMIEDLWFPQTADGRGSKVTTLPGGEGLGNIDDLKYFNNKLLRGLRVPSSYVASGPDDGQQAYNDGRTGAAFIQEFRFSQYCQRLQRLLEPSLDKEFKLFIRQRGIDIESSLFDLEFNVPENFSDWAKIEKQQAQINLFTSLVEMNMFSKRWLMMEYLGLTRDEIDTNEQMWELEHPDDQNTSSDVMSGGSGGAEIPGLDSMGMNTDIDMGGDMNSSDESSEMSSLDDISNSQESPISGGENQGGGEE